MTKSEFAKVFDTHSEGFNALAGKLQTVGIEASELNEVCQSYYGMRIAAKEFAQCEKRALL